MNLEVSEIDQPSVGREDYFLYEFGDAHTVEVVMKPQGLDSSYLLGDRQLRRQVHGSGVDDHYHVGISPAWSDIDLVQL